MITERQRRANSALIGRWLLPSLMPFSFIMLGPEGWRTETHVWLAIGITCLIMLHIHLQAQRIMRNP